MDISLVLVVVSSFLISSICCFLLIPVLQKVKFGQSIRDCGPKEHMKKAGTPTMGGLALLPAVIISTLFFSKDYNIVLFLALFLFIGHGLIGFADDYIIVVLKRNLGLTAKQKLAAQLLVAFIFLFFIHDQINTNIFIPFFDIAINIGVFYYLLVILLLLGSTNAVNLTDGLDGLAAGATIPVMLAYFLIAFINGFTDLSVFALSVVGACMGFLVFNYNPAKIFMGDTGSLALGGAVAAMALLTKTELLLVLIGGLYVLEALSVIIQVLSFKFRKKRVFRMSPLHHHYELGGWHEKKVVMFFWFLSCSFSFFGFLIYFY